MQEARLADFDLTTPKGRVATYLDYLWKDHAYLRLGFSNAHWISDELVRTNQPWPHQLAEWKKRGHEPGGLTEGFRGYDGIFTAVEAIKVAGKAEPAAIKDALWKVKVPGVYGDIAFIKQGPAGSESGQNQPTVYLVKIDGGKVIIPEF